MKAWLQCIAEYICHWLKILSFIVSGIWLIPTNKSISCSQPVSDEASSLISSHSTVPFSQLASSLPEHALNAKKPVELISFYKDTEHVLTHPLWKTTDLSDRLKQNVNIAELKKEITHHQGMNSTKGHVFLLESYQELLQQLKCNIDPDINKTEQFFPLRLYLTSKGGHTPFFSINGEMLPVSIKNLKGGSGCELTIFSQDETNLFAIKRFTNLEEGLNELLYSLIALDINPCPQVLKMARIYDAFFDYDDCLNLLMEGANIHVIHHFLATDLAKDVIKACAEYFATFHVRNYLKNNQTTDRLKYIAHGARFIRTLIDNPLKEENQERSLLHLLSGKQRTDTSHETVRSYNIIRVLPELEQQNFIHLVKGICSRFEENCKLIFRFYQLQATGGKESYFLTTTHGDAHGNNFFYNNDERLNGQEVRQDSCQRVTMIDVGKVARTYGDIGDPAEDVGRFLGSLWDWFFLQNFSESEATKWDETISDLQNQFIHGYLQNIEASKIFQTTEQQQAFKKTFMENCTFYKLRFYRAVFNFHKDKDGEKDKEIKVKILRSWIKENMNADLLLQDPFQTKLQKKTSKDRPWKGIEGSVIRWLPDRSKDFIESASEGSEKSNLTLLWKELHHIGLVTLTSSATLTGMGGIGKTTLALEYAHEALENNAYNLVYWLLSETEFSLIQGYKSLLQDIGVSIKDQDDDQVIDLVKQYIPKMGKCLLIYDNVPSSDFLKNKIPQANTNILITSRCNQGWNRGPINLEVFRSEDSVKYLLNTIELEANPDNKEKAAKLAHALGHFPLALSHAAHYIKLVRGDKVTGKDLEEYLHVFREESSAHFEELKNPFKEEELEMTYENLIGKTYVISSRHISESARKLMMYFAYLDADSITKDLFIGGTKEERQAEERVADKELDLDFSTLSALSLIKPSQQFFSIHRLVQLVIRHEKESKKNQQYEEIFSHLIPIFITFFEKNISTLIQVNKLLDNLHHILQLLKHSKRLHFVSQDVRSLEWIGKILYLLKRDTVSEESFYAHEKRRILQFREYNDKRLQQISKKAQDLFEDSVEAKDLPHWLVEIAEKGRPEVQNVLGNMYENSLFVTRDYEKSILWYIKAVHQNYAAAQFRLKKFYDSMRKAEEVKRLTEASKQGDSEAQAKLAMRYRTYGGDEKKAVELYTMAAEQGHADSQFHLATMYHYGHGVDMSDTEAVKCLTMAAEQGHSEAQVGLGIMYAKGRGLDQDDTEAIKWFLIARELGNEEAQSNLEERYPNHLVDMSKGMVLKWFIKAANRGLAFAQYKLGELYESGQGIPKDEKKAVELYTMAAEQGHSDAQGSLGIMYAIGQGVDHQDDSEAIRWLTKSAKQGNTNAQANLGIIYATDDRQIKKDEKKAIKWFTKAAEHGHAGAQRLLGEMYANGLGVDQDVNEAISWYSLAAKQGDVETIKYLKELANQGHAGAQRLLGEMYANGLGVDQDVNEMITWYTLAAEQGDARAQFNLGELYESGQGIPKDEKKAVDWYTLAAEQENRFAQTQLAVMYAEGRGVDKNDTESLKWLTKVAEQGDTAAQMTLGWIYNTGQGVDKNDSEAIRWFIRAAKQGYDSAWIWLEWTYPNGQWIDKDNTHANNWYTMDTDLEYANARYRFGFRSINAPKDEKKCFEWYTVAANQGDIEAQFNLGYMYLRGLGVDKDEKKAFKWFKDAAKQGYEKAAFNLGLMYIKGEGVNKDDKKAFKWFKEAAKRGDFVAQFNLGLMCMNGQGVYKDEKEALKWYSLADARGYLGARFVIKIMSYNKEDTQRQIMTLTEQDPLIRHLQSEKLSTASVSSLISSTYSKLFSALGTRKAVTTIPHIQSVKDNDEKATKYLIKAAELGVDEKAQFDLGEVYFDIDIDVDQAVEYYIMNCNKEANAENRDIFLIQRAIECLIEAAEQRRSTKAIEYLNWVEEHGQKEVQYMLGKIYEDGRDMIKQDHTKAFKYYIQAAKQGHASAQNWLGMTYIQGRWWAQCGLDAGTWYVTMAHKDLDAQFKLGLMYTIGLEGIVQDDAKAVECFIDAAKRGHVGAKALLSKKYDPKVYTLKGDEYKGKATRNLENGNTILAGYFTEQANKNYALAENINSLIKQSIKATGIARTNNPKTNKEEALKEQPFSKSEVKEEEDATEVAQQAYDPNKYTLQGDAYIDAAIKNLEDGNTILAEYLMEEANKKYDLAEDFQWKLQSIPYQNTDLATKI